MYTLIRFKGWKAVLVLALVVACWVAVYRQASRTLNTEAVEALKPWLVSAYARSAIEEIAGKSPDRLSKEELKSLSERLIEAGRIQIVSIRMRGSGDDVVCRVEVLLDGHPPRDGKTIRYFDMSYSLMSGWMCRGETYPWAYYFALF